MLMIEGITMGKFEYKKLKFVDLEDTYKRNKVVSVILSRYKANLLIKLINNLNDMRCSDYAKDGARRNPLISSIKGLFLVAQTFISAPNLFQVFGFYNKNLPHYRAVKKDRDIEIEFLLIENR